MDGSLLVIVPAAVIAILGIVMSAVIAINSSDQFIIVDDNNNNSFDKGVIISPTTTTTTTEAVDKNKNGCRGLFCSSSPQQEDVDSLRNFMESITKTKTKSSSEMTTAYSSSREK